MVPNKFENAPRDLSRPLNPAEAKPKPFFGFKEQPKPVEMPQPPKSQAEIQKQKWLDLEKQPIREGELSPEKYQKYLENMTIAKSMLDKMMLASQMPGGFPMIESNAEKLNELLREQIMFRAEAAHSRVTNPLRTAGMTPEQSIEKGLDALRDKPMLNNIVQELDKIGKAIVENPAEVLEGGAAAGFSFWMKYRNTVALNMGSIASAEKTLKDLQANTGLLSTYPDLLPLLDQYQAAIQALKQSDDFINPLKRLVGATRVEVNEWWAKLQESRKINTKPLRVIGAVGGAVVTTLGLAYSLIKGQPLSWPIAFWAGITTLSVNPDILKGGAFKDEKRVMALHNPETNDFITKWFKGDTGVKAYENLQEIAQGNNENTKALKELSKLTRPLTNAEIGRLTDGKPDNPLTKVLLSIPENKRVGALRLFGRKMSRYEQEYMIQYIRTRIPAPLPPREIPVMKAPIA
jgi:hypothetical protein